MITVSKTEYNMENAESNGWNKRKRRATCENPHKNWNGPILRRARAHSKKIKRDDFAKMGDLTFSIKRVRADVFWPTSEWFPTYALPKWTFWFHFAAALVWNNRKNNSTLHRLLSIEIKTRKFPVLRSK